MVFLSTVARKSSERRRREWVRLVCFVCFWKVLFLAEMLTISGSLGSNVTVGDGRPVRRDLVEDEAVGLCAEDLESLLGDLGNRDVLPSLAAHDDWMGI